MKLPNIPAQQRDWPIVLFRGYVVLFFLFTVLPIVIVVVISFSDRSYVSFPIEEVSFRWFKRIYEYEPYFNSFIVTLEVAFLSALFAVLLGVPAALVLARHSSQWANAIVVFLLSPLAIPSIVIGYSMLFFFSFIGLGVSLTSLVIAHTVCSIPYIVRTVAGIYRSVSPNIEESAMILGANRWQVFRHATFPAIRPGIFAGATFAILISIDNLSVSYFFASPSTNTLPVVILSYLEHQFDPSIAAASTVQLIVAAILLFVVERTYGLRSLAF